MHIKTESSEKLSIRIIDTNGRIINQFTSAPQDTIDFGSELSSDLHLIEVCQGMERTVVKAQKI